MKDIPVFQTEYGVASLILREIPYRERAYIKIQSSLSPEQLLEECTGFCRACGAQRIVACGDAFLEKYPHYTTVLAMQHAKESLPQAEACLFPITENTLDQWISIYNERMSDVPNAAYMDSRDARALLEAGDGYFVHRDGKLLGIGKAAGDTIEAVISCVPGSGEQVVLALCELLTADTVRLQVAENNRRAVRLYERMGFLTTGEVSRWYRVL